MAAIEDDTHVEEQAMEIEALESIYADDLRLLDNESAHPSTWNASQGTGSLNKPVYMIAVYPQGDEDDGSVGTSAREHELGIELYFAHSVSYPEANPFVHVSSVRGLSVDQVAQCTEVVSSAVEENAGMPMIFTLVTAVQDWVNGLNEAAAAEAKANDPKEQEQRRRMEEEERILNLRKHGHEVTVDSFLAWREQFLAESASREADEMQSHSAKMTGKAWFLQQQTPVEEEVEEYAEYDEGDFSDSATDEEAFGGSSSDDDDLLDELEARLE